MFKLLQYYSRFSALRGGYAGLPSWARLLVAIMAVPGIVLILLSIIALLVSIAALLLLTVPVYRLVQWACGSRSTYPNHAPMAADVSAQAVSPQAPRHRVDVTIIE